MAAIHQALLYSDLSLLFLGRDIWGGCKTQEDVNGEKLTMKKCWSRIFGADFITAYAELFTVYKGHKR